MIRSLSVLILLVGAVWALTIAWAFISLRGVSTPISTHTIVVDYGLALIGPACLILGSILILSGSAPKVGALLSMLACLVLTGLTIYQFAPSLRPDPLQVRPPYLFNAVLMFLILLVDFGAFRLYQLVTKR